MYEIAKDLTNGNILPRSSEWSLLSDREKKDMELTFDDDGEFWYVFQKMSANQKHCFLYKCQFVEKSRSSMEILLESDTPHAGSMVLSFSMS